MNVASSELCLKLYALTKWEIEDLRFWHGEQLLERNYVEGVAYHSDKGDVPAYDLGYLMRKLPKRENDDITTTVMLGRGTNNRGWSVVYKDLVCLAPTPEDACAKMAIALAKRDAAIKYFLN